jgi:hypothetical protein
VPTQNVHSDLWDHEESYAIRMLLARRLKITFTSSLELIVSFLVSTYYVLPSLDSHSSLVRVGTLLFLFSSYCISGLGQRGLLHNCMIPSRNLVTGVVIARTLPYARLPTDAPTRARITFGSRVKTCLFSVLTPTSLFYEEVIGKSSTKKGLLYALEESCEEHFKCLSLDTPLWRTS